LSGSILEAGHGACKADVIRMRTELWAGWKGHARSLSAAAVAPPLRVLALVPDPQTCVSGLKIARAAAAIDPAAHITALHVAVDPASLRFATAEEIDLLELRAVTEGDFRQRRDETFRLFTEWKESTYGRGAPVTWREVIGSEEEVVDVESAAAHLVAIAKPATVEGHEALHAAIFSHRHLVLHTPFASNVDPEIGKIIAIAWKPTEATRRAIFRTERWLGRASEVHLITVDRDDYDAAVRELRDLEIKPVVHRIARGSGSVGEAVMARAHAVGADSLVLGAYRHGALLGAMLGGVTHHVLRHGDIPAFLVH